MRKILTAMWICCIVLFLSGTTVFAQTITGSVRGTVTDPSGAVVAGANVTATNVATGVATDTVTNRSGLYNFQFLVLGNYTITATASGFNSTSIGPFRLQIDQIAEVNPQLQVGAASTTVKVSSAAGAILNTTNATLGTSISSNQLQSMPLPGLNALYATLFVPGAVNPTASSMGGLQGAYRNTTSDGVPSFNGNRQQGNNFVLDGIEINETIANTNGYNPSPYSLQEIRVITGNADAEYGNVDGAEIIMVSKSGTNKFHGSAFEYFENQNFAANSWSNDYSGFSKAKFHQHQFGGAVGGPIFKNKLFFFADYEGFRNVQTGEAGASVPSLLEREGNFSEAAAVEGESIWDTTNGTNAATEYPNDTIPAILNPVANYLFANPTLLPMSNHPADPGTVTKNNYAGTSAKQYINNQGDGRIDYTINNNNTLMVKGTYGDAHDLTSQQPLDISLFPLTDNYPFAMGVINWIHTFSPSLVNEARAGYSRVVQDTETSDPTGAFGKNGDSVVGIPFPNQPIVGFSQMNIYYASDNSSYGTSNYAGTKAIDNNFDYGDDITWVHGNHITRVGAQFVRYQENYVQPSNLGGLLGIFLYQGLYTAAGPSIGSGYADFELDKAQSAQVSGVTGPFGSRQWRDAYYIQDDWKVMPNLTLNLGLRYAYDQPMYETHDKMVSVDLKAARFAPTGTDPSTFLEFAGKNGNSRALVNPFYGQVMPRLGFAAQINPRTVIRGGYAITDDSEGTGDGLRMTQNPPFNVAFTQNSPTPSPTAGGIPLSVTNGFTSANPGAINAQYDVWDPHFRPAMVQQYNLTTQYLLASKTSLQVGYVGQVARHVAVPVLQNQYIAPAPTGPDCPPSDTTGCVDLVAPYYVMVGGNSQIVETQSEAYGNYNALQAVLHQQETNGLEFTFNYTWARAMSNSPVGFLSVDGTENGFNYWQNAYDPHADYGPTSFDVRNNFSGTIVYQLPFGHEKRYGADWNRLTDAALGGWQLSANVSALSGFPLIIRANGNDNLNSATTNDNYNFSQRANHYRPMRIVHRTLTNWFGTDPSAVACSTPGVDNGVCAYGRPAFDQFGTSQNGTERGPGQKNVDLSVFKGFRTVGNQTFKLRLDAYNAFNLPSYGQPQNRAGQSAGTYGSIRSTTSAPRQVQISGVYTF